MKGLVHNMDKSFFGLVCSRYDKSLIFCDFSHCPSRQKMFSHLIQSGIYYRIRKNNVSFKEYTLLGNSLIIIENQFRIILKCSCFEDSSTREIQGKPCSDIIGAFSFSTANINLINGGKQYTWLRISSLKV